MRKIIQIIFIIFISNVLLIKPSSIEEKVTYDVNTHKCVPDVCGDVDFNILSDLHGQYPVSFIKERKWSYYYYLYYYYYN